MRTSIKILVLLLMLATASWSQVIHKGELDSSLRLVLDNGVPYVVGEFHNRTNRPIPIHIPAGVQLIGQREPCNPVVLGRGIKLTVPPGGSKAQTVEALSVSFYSHTAGPYTIGYPGEQEVMTGRFVQYIWRLHRSSPLRNSPIRICQIIVYGGYGANGKKITQTFTKNEMDEAEALVDRFEEEDKGTSFAHAARPESASEFTTTDPKKVTIVEDSLLEKDPEIDHFKHLCPGLGGYQVIHEGGDLRSWINLKFKGRSSDLMADTWAACPGQFPEKANKVVQWRGFRTAKGFAPYAIIYRMMSSADDAEQTRLETFIIIKLAGEKSRDVAHVVAHVPAKDGNQKAEQVADRLCSP